MNKLAEKPDLTALQKRLGDPRRHRKPCVVVCDGPGCNASGSRDIYAALSEAVDRAGLSDRLDARLSGCLGLCEAGPVVLVLPDGIFYQHVSPGDVPDIVTHAVEGKGPVERLLYVEPADGERIAPQKDVPFYRLQERRLLANNAYVRPDSIDDYIAADGYSAAAKALTTMTPEAVIEEVTQAQIRGRGGAGFPTGIKWGLCRKSPGDEKTIICNADEGDPGAYMDRALLEGTPHSVIEGMIIGGYAIGASHGIIYCRAEYPIAVRNATHAIAQAKEYGLLGTNIFGSGFDFELTVKTGAGAFVCGEETALIASLEDQMGTPRPRPPFPAQAGLWGKPTNINNVETWANVTLALRHGAEWYASVGTEKSKGTKVFSLVGRVRNTGLVEVPMGISLRELIFDIGGGPLPGRKIKAVQIGGPSGGCIPAHLFDLPVDYESLTQAGAIMGSGGLIVMDNRTCMVDVAKYFLSFLAEESCGKCVPCREGIPRMLEILTRIAEGNGRAGDLDLLEQLALVTKNMSLCGLGQTAGNPVLSSLRYFRDEFEEHIAHKRCPAAVGKKIISSPCQHVCPLHADAPAYVTLIGQGKYVEAAEVICKTNPLPNVCARVCHHPCESSCSCGEAGDPIAVKALKRFAMDRAVEAGRYPPPNEKPDAARTERVAVVGSGPAGLTAAFYLAREGFQVTVFEATDRVGGALATAIPEYRLPRDVLDRDIQRIKNLGVQIRTNTRIGMDISFDQLRSEFQAVFAAIGAEKNLRLGIPGEDAEGVLDPLGFLQRVKHGDHAKPGDDVIVIGGGNVAVDAARTALRLGCRRIRVLYRRTREEMPADPAEIDEMLREGVIVEYLTAPKEILVTDGRVSGIRCQRMELGGMDAGGRRKPVPIEGHVHDVEADTVIPAIGSRPEGEFLSESAKKLLSDRGLVRADTERFVTVEPGIFAGGDAVLGPATVTQAMATGSFAAESIRQYLEDEPIERMYAVTRPTVDVPPIQLTDQEMDELLDQARPTMPTLPAESRVSSFEEVELGLDEAAAVAEAKRCLRCDRSAVS